MPKVGVEQYLATLAHSRKDDILRLREVIFAADPALREAVKWNAPSYGYDDDRITFRLQPGDRVELIFHRGARPRALNGFAFDDPSGLLKFVAPDRAVLAFADGAAIEAHATPLAGLIRRWMAATG